MGFETKYFTLQIIPACTLVRVRYYSAYRYCPSAPPEDLVIGSSILYHQEGSEAIASTVDKEDQRL